MSEYLEKLKSVYFVMDYWPDVDSEVVGVFATRKLAQKFIDKERLKSEYSAQYLRIHRHHLRYK